MDKPNKNILVVDDNAELVNILKLCLESRGYAVSVAYDGEEAVRLIQTTTPALVILDITMPKRNGIEVCRDMCTRYGHSRVPLLIATGHHELKDIFNEAEVDGFISKPYELELLLKEVERILFKHNQPNIFLIDFKENPHAQDILRVLNGESYKVEVVADMKEWEKSSHMPSPPQLIFMEYIRPDMEGRTFITELKKRSAILWPMTQIPIVVYSYSGFNYEEKSLVAGADLYLGQPSNYDIFIKTARQYEIKSHSTI